MTAALMLSVAGFYDVLVFISGQLHWIPFLGTAAAFISNLLVLIWAWFSFWLWFRAHKVSLIQGKRAVAKILAMVAGAVLNFIPYINLSAWVVAIGIIIVLTRVEDDLLALVQKVGKVSGTVGKVAKFAGKVPGVPKGMKQGLKQVGEGAQQISGQAKEFEKHIQTQGDKKGSTSGDFAYMGKEAFGSAVSRVQELSGKEGTGAPKLAEHAPKQESEAAKSADFDEKQAEQDTSAARIGAMSGAQGAPPAGAEQASGNADDKAADQVKETTGHIQNQDGTVAGPNTNRILNQDGTPMESSPTAASPDTAKEGTAGRENSAPATSGEKEGTDTAKKEAGESGSETDKSAETGGGSNEKGAEGGKPSESAGEGAKTLASAQGESAAEAGQDASGATPPPTPAEGKAQGTGQGSNRNPQSVSGGEAKDASQKTASGSMAQGGGVPSGGVPPAQATAPSSAQKPGTTAGSLGRPPIGKPTESRPSYPPSGAGLNEPRSGSPAFSSSASRGGNSASGPSFSRRNPPNTLNLRSMERMRQELKEVIQGVVKKAQEGKEIKKDDIEESSLSA